MAMDSRGLVHHDGMSADLLEPHQDHVAARRTLAALLDAVATGQFPAADGSVVILPQPSERDAGVIALTGFAVIFADTGPDWVTTQLSPGDLSGPLSPGFLHALSNRLGRHSHNIDMLTCADPLAGPPSQELGLTELTPGSDMPSADHPGAARTANTADAHPRIARALRHRDDVRAWQTRGGVVMLGRGVASRYEVAIEVDPAHRGRGLGAELAKAARHLVPDGAPLWAQIAPGNAASVRAFLAAGFRPVGAEALLSRDSAD